MAHSRQNQHYKYTNGAHGTAKKDDDSESSSEKSSEQNDKKDKPQQPKTTQGSVPPNSIPPIVTKPSTVPIDNKQQPQPIKKH